MWNYECMLIPFNTSGFIRIIKAYIPNEMKYGISVHQLSKSSFFGPTLTPKESLSSNPFT